MPAICSHRSSDLPFDDRPGEHGEEVADEQRIDAVRGLQEHRSDRSVSLQHVVSPLEFGLVAIGGEHLGGCHVQSLVMSGKQPSVAASKETRSASTLAV